MIDYISPFKKQVNRTDDVLKFDGKSLVVMLPGHTCSQPESNSFEILPIKVSGCTLTVEASEESDLLCFVKLEEEILFSPNVTELKTLPHGVYLEQPDILNPRSGYLSQEQVNSIVINNPSISNSKEEDFMLIIN
jgi:hypothetical protein